MIKTPTCIMIFLIMIGMILVSETPQTVYAERDDNHDDDEEFPDYDENKCDTGHIMSKCYDWSKFYDDEITEDNVDVYCDNKPDLTNFEQERCDRLYDMLGR